MMDVAKESKGGFHMPAPQWLAIFFIQPLCSNGDGGIDLLVRTFDPNPDAVKAFVGCPKNTLAFISKPYETSEEADKAMRGTMETMGVGALWHPGPLDRMVQLPDIKE